jgi:hypothetical protein
MNPNYECLGTYVFTPYTAENGTFALTVWNTGRRDEYRKHVIAYRFAYSDQLVEHVLFEGEDYYTHDKTFDDVVRGLMGFLTLRPGDTDQEYFRSYTPEQLEYCQTHAEALAIEVICQLGE